MANFANLLQYLFNLSFEKGIFPDDLNIAKVTPVFKAEDITKLSSYRPIYVLPFFSKILQRVQIFDSNILNKRQFGFQEGHSTDHAIQNLKTKCTTISSKTTFYVKSAY